MTSVKWDTTVIMFFSYNLYYWTVFHKHLIHYLRDSIKILYLTCYSTSNNILLAKYWKIYAKYKHSCIHCLLLLQLLFLEDHWLSVKKVLLWNSPNPIWLNCETIGGPLRKDKISRGGKWQINIFHDDEINCWPCFSNNTARMQNTTKILIWLLTVSSLFLLTGLMRHSWHLMKFTCFK